MRVSIIILILIFALKSALFAGSTLTLNDCIETALKNQPTIMAAQGSLGAGLGREMQAKSAYYPQVTATSGYNENRTQGGAFGASVTKSYTTTLQGTQTLYDFGKTGNAVDAARWNIRSSEQDLDRVTQDVILNVKQAYFALLAARQLVLVEQQRVDQTESHLKQAQAFFSAGSKPRFDVTRAEVEVNNANLGLINAKNSVRIRTIALNNAMGIDPGMATEIDHSFPPSPEMPSLDKAQSDALKNRPELLKADADIESAKARVRAEEANYLPTLSVNGAYNWANGTQDLGQLPTPIPGVSGRQLVGDIKDSWSAGISLTFPLFQGGVTKGRVSEARANLLTIQAQRNATRQSILLEVNQSFADLESAKVRIGVMESQLQKARESLELAQGRYEAGVGPSIEVTDAQLASVQAQTDHIQAQYDYQLSLAKLLKATGSGGAISHPDNR